MMLEHSNQTTNGQLILSSVATPARKTAPQETPPITAQNRALAVSSSALLVSFARALFSAKIQPSSERMLPGLGGDFDLSLSRLVTLCCPFDCERVALGLSTNGTACSCSPSLPTPSATDWRGGKKKRKTGTQANLRDEFTQRTGWLYLHPVDLEAAMGLPNTWTELSPSGMQSTRMLLSGSGNE